MDTMFIWIVAGAAIGLLGIFLVASEKELKRKRQELEELKNKFADGPAPVIANSSTDVFPQDNGASAELIARNEELLQQISSLSKKLEASESRLEQLETLRAHLNSKESEVTELRWDRERLQAELATAKTPSESNDPHLDEASRNRQKDAEIAALKEQLEASQAKVRDLESAPVQPADAESGQKAFEELQRSLEVSTSQLQNALAAEQEKQKALEATQMQLSDMQQRHHELSEANLRLREENSQHQQKLTNQNQLQVERLVILRQRLEELRSKQAKVSEQDRLIQEEIVSMSELLDVAPEHTHQPEPRNTIPHDCQSMFEFRENESTDTAQADIVERTPFGQTAPELHSIHNDSFDKTNGISAEPQHHHSANLTTAIAVGTPLAGELSPRPGLKEKKRRFGIFTGAVGVLVVGGVLAAGYLGKDSEPESSATQPASPMSKEQRAKFEAMRNPSRFSTAANMESQPKPAETQSQDGDSIDKPIRIAPAIPLAPPVESRIVEKSEKATTTIASSGKASSTAWESYEIVQPTRVFSAPSEHSQLVANVEPGTQVNVVDSRNGWLEIRSKHGRPPGFIQKTAAKRIGQKN
jgi:hypothetical protein